MARDPASPPLAGDPFYANPWILLAAGLAGAVPGWLLPYVWAPPAELRLGLLFVGTFLTLVAVVTRLRQAKWDLPERIESAAMVSLAGLGALFGYLGMKTEWASGQMFYAALFILSVGGTVLILLPSVGRRIVLSLLLLFHFGGMAVAITSVDPPNSVGPWLSKQLWSRVYRPYLMFTYLSNAYHFYSPDPGPPTLLWFAVQYDDGSFKWVKLPDRDNSPIGMHYQRMLALPEHSFAQMPRLPFYAAELTEVSRENYPARGSWEEIYHRRELGSTLLFSNELPIPMVDVEAAQQYREPNEPSKRLIAAIAKRILWKAEPTEDGAKAKTIKVYRVIHSILSPQELSQGVSPWDKTKYLPYFIGEYDRQGELVDSLEPFLYWYLPIVKVPDGFPNHGGALRPGVPLVNVRVPAKTGFLLDTLEMHAAGQLTKERKEKK